MSQKLPAVSIICINWNGSLRLGKFLDDLRAIDYPRQLLELVIQDNASSDNSRDIIRGKFREMELDGWHRLVLLESDFHPGPTRGHIRAYNATDAASEYVLSIDTDVRLVPGSLRILLMALEKEKKAAVAGCKVLYAAEPNLPNCGAIDFTWWSIHNRIYYPDLLTECDEILDCVYLFRRESIGDLEYFHDEALWFFCVGKDLFSRLKRAGWKVFYVPDAVAYHDAGYTSGRHSSLRLYLNVRDAVVYHKKNSRPLFAWAFILRLILSAVKHYFTNGTKLYFSAIADGFSAAKMPVKWWDNEMRNI